MIKLFKQNTFKWSLLGMGVLVLIAGMALTNAKGGTPDPGAPGKAVSHKVDLLYGKLQVALPASWGLKVEHETEVKVTVEGDNDRGGILIVGFDRDQPSGWRPNHSIDISAENITTPLGKGELAVLEMSYPAASGNDDTWQEIHAVIPIANKNLAYDFWFKADQSAEQDTLLLKQMLSEVKPIIDQQGTEAEGDAAAVAKLVEDFGGKLQTVSLLAPKEIVNKSMQENYSDFVSPALLAEWQNDPQNAPGRVVSSPWPDRIEIQSLKRLSEHEYEVKGEIMEITSVEKVNGGVAAKRPITLVAKKIGNHWLIDAATLGAYGEADSIVYENTQYGFSFSLPVSWQGYSIVTDKWEGLAIGGPEIVETGPLLSIRHPQWTAQNPRQDIPIMVFTLAQWNSLQQENFHIGAAPIGPKELGRNSKYVLALPARYNYAFPAGFEEVEKILASNPLQANEE